MFRLLLLASTIFAIGFSENALFTPVPLDLNTNENYTFQINHEIQYILQFKVTILQEPPRIWIHSEDANVSAPILIVASQSKEVLSWQLPLIVQGDLGEQKYTTMARSLCYDLTKKTSGTTETQTEDLILIVTTISETNLNFTVSVIDQELFEIRPLMKYDFVITPSEPRYLFYNFTTNSTLTTDDLDNTVVVEVHSDDDNCMTVSIQNITCPVFDTDLDVTFRGYYETVDRSGGITVSNRNFPLGFYVVFVAKTDDYDCTNARVSSSSLKVKNISLVVKPILSNAQYVVAVLWPLGIIGIFYIIFGCSFYVCGIRRSPPRHMNYIIQVNDSEASTSAGTDVEPLVEQTNVTVEGNEIEAHNSAGTDVETLVEQTNVAVEIEVHISAGTAVEPLVEQTNVTVQGNEIEAHNSAGTDVEPLVEQSNVTVESIKIEAHNSGTAVEPSVEQINVTVEGNEIESHNSEVTEDVESLLEQTENNCKSLYYYNGRVSLADLATKEPIRLKKKSYLYLYNILMVAIYYGQPVLQLAIFYQIILNETGKQDLCYYNFLCANPLGPISDFNHIFSNSGYVLFGALFIIITYARQSLHKDINFDSQYGIPHHYGLFYAMGVALIVEGVLSGCYHVCPNQSNFQFDTSFMYVMAVLCGIKLYQNRHPDINASAYATFSLLAIAILLVMFGIFEGSVVFWSIFSVLYVLTCFYLSIKIYYMGHCSINKDIVVRVYQVTKNDLWTRPLNVLTPHYTARFVLLMVGNLWNCGLIIFFIYKDPENFSMFLLAMFMSNTLIYFFYYIIMKYVNKERVKLLTWIFLLISVVCGAGALYYFQDEVTSWSLTPSESRKFNQECLMLNFYDSHDFWHFLSATGMFFAFMVLLTLDDDLSHVKHSKTAVF